MKSQKFLIIVILFFNIYSLHSQENTKNEFKPSLSPFFKVYSNFNYGLSSANDKTAFQLTRAYVGYSFKLSSNYSGKVNFDVGSPSVDVNDSVSVTTSLMQTSYLKNAYLSYKNDNLTIAFGLIGTKQFKLQETVWGLRYLYKSFQDQHKFNSSADLGISLDYKLSKQISVDLSVINGEGYKKLQADNKYRTGLGITAEPITNFVVRAYYDFIKKTETQTSLVVFAGYNSDKLAAGVEYNIQNNNKDKADHDLTGISAYASYSLNKKYRVFGRYDQLSSNTLQAEVDPWNNSKNGNVIIMGLQFNPVKNIKMALNYQGWTYEDDTKDAKPALYMNIEYKF